MYGWPAKRMPRRSKTSRSSQSAPAKTETMLGTTGISSPSSEIDAGNGTVPVPIFVTVAGLNSVSPKSRGRSARRNSMTVPETLTRSPGATLRVAASLGKTKMPSEVAGFPSPFSSCMKKPRPSATVTIPVVRCCVPAYGETCPAP
jgi:hypothetical protein